MMTSHNRHIATGFAGDGMGFGTLSAIIIADCLTNKENVWQSLYTTKRLKSIADIAKFNTSFVKEFFSRRTHTEPADVESIAPGSGKIVEVHGKKMAVFKHENGEITKLSPVCTHVHCIVDWNHEENTWDCPCHGTRFSCTGSVITGPAKKPLPPIADNT